ncbi:nucleoside 2-deoxyribosyltransferase domain-containing protein [Tersicoccus sp. MR15.9]|uniref:nucleoside 2-deoxyribosyltransferase domain-containing protein n=1 Tax=Tersicoccus mangrovi TaxID=3121635 RepID=UPI002FE5C1D7
MTVIALPAPAPAPVRHSAHVLVQAPARLPEKVDLFLAGGVTGTAPWQSEVAAALAHLPATVANPRRGTDFDATGPEAAAQIGWERRALARARFVLFWFTSTSIQPFTLFELGSMLGAGKPIIIGAHPEYPYRRDVVHNLQLARPAQPVHASLEDLVSATIDRLGHRHAPGLDQPLAA